MNHSDEENADMPRPSQRLSNAIACDLLLARLFQNHPEDAITALKGTQPRVSDAVIVPIEETKPAEAPFSDKPPVVPFPWDDGSDLDGLRPTPQEIISLVCWYYEVSQTDIKSHRRTADITWPRHVAVYLVRQHTLCSLPAIGKIMGGRDHTTILHSCDRVKREVEDSSRRSDDIEVLGCHIADIIASKRKAAA